MTAPTLFVHEDQNLDSELLGPLASIEGEVSPHQVTIPFQNGHSELPNGALYLSSSVDVAARVHARESFKQAGEPGSIPAAALPGC